jgi:hypothetical protein
MLAYLVLSPSVIVGSDPVECETTGVLDDPDKGESADLAGVMPSK